MKFKKEVFEITRNKFEDLYSCVINGYVDDLKDIQKKLGVNCLKYSEKRARRIYRYYEKKRLYIRRYFMNLECKPMDRHKIAAVLVYAILKSSPFYVDRTIANLPNELLMANEYLAFCVAINVIELYRLDDAMEKNDILDKYHLIMPKTYHGDEYVDNVCKALYYVKNPDYFDIFAFSNILFLLETYTDKCYEK